MKRIATLLVGLCLTIGLSAQPYEIYPTPHRQAITSGTAHFTPTVGIIAEPGIDAATIDRAKQVLTEHGLTPALTSKAVAGQSCLMLGVAGSKGVADRQADRLKLDRSVFTLNKYDRHIICLTADKNGAAQVLALGENTDATFMALASLEQMLDQSHSSPDLPCVQIYDYADVRQRGVIEGYYGVPYSAEVTKDLFRFMARYKLNTYMYGAKSDPYHSRFWGEPYPTSITAEQLRIGYLTQDMLRDITSVAHATKVNFIWAIHPGTAFVNAERTDVIPQIMKKLESMYGLGVRQFGVFVDDVGVPSDAPTLKLGADRLTELQKSIDARWNRPGVAPADTVKPLHYVPQLYAYSWVSRQQGKTFFEALSPVPAKVSIYITGANVWSVPNNYDLELVHSWLGRNTSWWWNYPCNDNDVTKLFPLDTYANFRDERHIANLARLEPQLTGTDAVIINPMQQGEVSKIALFSVADYTWNTRAFDNHRSFEAAIPAVVGNDYADAFRTVAPCLRYFDADALAYEVNNYKASVNEGHPRPGALTGLLSRINAACEKLKQMKASTDVSQQLFYEDMRPWLTKLKAMTKEATQLINGKASITYDYENDPAFQFPILNGMGEDISLVVKTAEPSAEVLRPFIEWMRDRAKEHATTCVNPLTYTDIPDNDVIRVGDDYYMVSTTMFFCPGAPIMHSKDLVHWRIVSYIYDCLADDDIYNLRDGKNAYGKGQWATTLRYHDGVYYALFIANDQHKTYVYRTTDIRSSNWERNEIEGAFFHDASLLFDDGHVYVVYGNGDLRITELTPDLRAIKPDGVNQVLISTPRQGFGLRAEGAHFYHIGNYYYVIVIDWPQGKPRTERCFRSSTLLGEYEGKVILQGAFDGRGDGVAQGAIFDTPRGDWYSVMFQDHGAVGRIPTLQPVTWVDGWPMLGDNGVPVKQFNVNLTTDGEDYVWANDEFNHATNTLPLVWQWNHKPIDADWSFTARKGWLRLTTSQLATNIFDARNTLTQRTAGPRCIAETCLDASAMRPGDRAGLCAFMSNYCTIGVEVDNAGKRFIVAKSGSRRSEEEVMRQPLKGKQLWLRIKYVFTPQADDTCGPDKAFMSYSTDGQNWIDIDHQLNMRFTLDLFVGYRSALYNYATATPGGHADFDYFHQQVY